MKQPQKSIVELARERYDASRDYWQPSKLRTKQDIEFSFGDCFNGFQYFGDYSRDQMEEQGMLTINIIEPACKKIINAVRMNRPQAKIEPGDGMASTEAAAVVEKWARGVKSRANIDDATDTALEDSVRGGEGYFELCLDYEDESSFKKTPSIRSLPYDCVWRDTNIKSQDGTDSEWDFIEEEISIEQAEREHPSIDPKSWTKDAYKYGWVKKDTVIRCKYYYCDYKQDTLESYTDGSVGFKSDKNGKEIAIGEDGKPVTRKTYRKEWWYCILLGGEDEPVHKERWYGKSSPIFGVYGQLYYESGVPYYKGETRNMIDTNRIVNYAFSKAVNSITKQQDAPWMASIESIGGINQPAWDLAAKGGNPQVYTFDAYTDDGKPLPQPQRIPPATTPSAELTLLQTALEQGQNVTGQFSLPGQHAKDTSGIAMERKNADGELATFHFPDNLGRALRALEQMLIDLFPTLVDDKEIIRLQGVDGTQENAQITRGLDQPYAEPINKNNAYNVKHWINPDQLGKMDVTITIGPSYKTVRAENADKVIDLVMKNPAMWATHQDLILAELDFQNSQAWVERAKKTMPPEIVGDDEEGGEPLPPQVQQQLEQQGMQMQEMDMHSQELMQQVQQLEKENQALQQQLAQAEAKAITDRIQAKRFELATLEKRAAQAQQIVGEDGADGEEDDTERMEDDDDIDPNTDALLMQMEENNMQQSEMLQIIASELAKPKKSIIKGGKQPDGTYVFEKIEE